MIFAVFSVLVGILLFAIWSNSYAYAQQSSSPSSSAVTSSMPLSPAPKAPQHITKIKVTSPNKGQQVPVGKDLTISGTSIDSASTNCQLSVIVNKVRPYQPATPTTATGTGGEGGGAAAANDYSKWNFVLTSKYTTIKPGQNRITAKYECANNPALTSFSSVNVTGVQATTTAATVATTTTPTATPTPKTTTTAALTTTPIQTTKSTATIATSIGGAPK